MSKELSEYGQKTKIRYEVVCPSCKKSRSLGYSAKWSIDKGINSPKCLDCSRSLTGKINGLKRKGAKISLNGCHNMSLARKEEWRLGKRFAHKCTEKQKQKMRGRKRTRASIQKQIFTYWSNGGYKHSVEIRRKISEAQLKLVKEGKHNLYKDGK